MKDKFVVITGAANGIGAFIVRELLREGVKQIRILDIDENLGVALQDELNQKYGKDKVKFVICDVTKEEQFFKALEDAKEENGYIDLMINNAGVGDETNLKSIRKLIEINYIAVVNGTLKTMELMHKDKGGRGGAIVNTSSIAGLAPICPPLFAYSSTKSAVLQFSSCIGKDSANNGVKVMSICYGVTETNLLCNLYTFGRSFDQELKNTVGCYPAQSTQSAAQGAIEVIKKGESATTWVIQNNEPARDITPFLEKMHAQMVGLLQGLE